MRLAAVALLATVALAGCGTDDQSSWSKRVEALCGELSDKAEARALELREQASGDTASQEEFVARVAETTAELGRPYVERMAALKPPAGKERQAARFFDLLRRTNDLYAQSAKAIRADDRPAIERIGREALKVAEAAHDLARELDVDECVPNAGR